MKNLRDFLEQREKELTEQLADRKRRAIPFEAELREVREAKRALNSDAPGAPTLLQMNALREYLEARKLELKTEIDKLGDPLEPVLNELSEVRKVKMTIGSERIQYFEVGISKVNDPLSETIRETSGSVPYQSMTIADLITKALREKFENGAPIRAMVDFFRDTWGRDIDRQSLSPQLTRLFNRGVVGRIRSLQYWFLIQPELRIAGQRPYLRSGVITWMDKEMATHADEPLIARYLDGSDDRQLYIRMSTDRVPGGTKGFERRLWLLPNEVQANDHQAYRYEPPGEEDAEG